MARNPLETFGQAIQSASQSADPNDVSRGMTMADIAIFGDSGLNDYYNQNYDYRLQDDPNLRANLAKQDRLAGAMPALDYGQMFPSASNNIQKGSYSGSEVGSIPIYAPGQLVPFGAFDARQRALAGAAQQKVAQEAEFYKQKAPITKRFAVQGELNDVFAKGQQQWVDNAKEQYGNNWTTALKNDPGYNKWLQSMGTVAQYETGIVDFIGDIDANIKSGEFVASPELLKAKSDFMAGVGGLENPSDPKGHDAGTNLLKMRAFYDLDKATNDAAKEIVKTVSDKYPGMSNQGIYDMIVKQTQTGVDEFRIKDVSAGVYKSKYADGQYFTQDDVYNSLLAKLGPVAKTYDVKTVKNQFGGAGGEEQVYDENVISPETQDVEFAGSPKGVTVFSGQTLSKPVGINVANATTAIDPKTGKPVNIAGNSKIQIGQTFNVLTDGKGNVVSAYDIEQAHKDKDYNPEKMGWEYKTYASGTIKAGDARISEVNAQGQTVSVPINQDQTMWMPVEGIKGGLATFDDKGNVTKGLRVDVQDKVAKEKTKELYSRHEKAAQTEAHPPIIQGGFTYTWNPSTGKYE